MGGVRQPITQAEFNTWVAFDPTNRAGTTLAQVRANVNATRLNSGVGGLPNDFFHVRLPEGFATTNPLSFNIATLEGYKLYRLRQTYDQNFGSLTAVDTTPRYVQFGIRIYF